MTARAQEGQCPAGVLCRDHRFFTPRRQKTSVCGCSVGSSAYKTHRRPKKHSSPEVPRIGHSCYTCTSQPGRVYAKIEIPHVRFTAQERGRVCARIEISHAESSAPEKRRVRAEIEIPHVRLTAHRDENKRVGRMPTATARQIAAGARWRLGGLGTVSRLSK